MKNVLKIFEPYSNVNEEYLLYQLYSRESLKHRYLHGKGDIIVHINITSLGNTTIYLPSDEDQLLAVKSIEKMIKYANSTISIRKQQIQTLQELKTRLIADVVTGKIDVRNVEIPEYEYTAEEAENDTEDFEEQEGNAE